jgi:hypothetical protein
VRMISDEFLDKLKERMLSHREKSEVNGGDKAASAEPVASDTAVEHPKTDVIGNVIEKQKRGVIETTEEELEFYRTVRDICVKTGSLSEDIIYKDTVTYFNVSFQRPSKWFVRFFGSVRRMNVVTRVPAVEAKQLLQGFEIEEAPAAFGISRIYIDSPAQAWAIEKVIRRSLEIAQSEKDDTTHDQPPEGE